MKGSLVGIKVAGNPQPFAVGRLLMSDMTEKTQSGVGVEVWTCYGDDIYKQTTASASVGVHNSNGGAPFDNGHYGNVGFLDAQLVRPIVEVGQEEEDDDCEEETKDDEELQSTDRASQTEMRGDEPTTEVDDTAAEESDAPSTAVSVVPQEPVSLSPDEILHLSMCRALVDLKDKDLPITAANLYANHVLTHRPPDATIQLKQTTYKKFGAYLVHLAEQGLINIGEDKKDQNPAGFLTSIDRSHPDLRGIKKTPSAAEAVKTKTTIVSLYSVPHHFEALLRLNPDDVKAANAKSEERKGTGLVTAQEAREILEKYCKDNELLPADAAEVTLDAALTDALYKKSKDSPPSRLSRKDLHAAWIKKMEPAYAVVLMPGSKIIKLARGTAPKVQMEVTMRQGKKFVTRLRGIEEYGIDGEYFCKDVSRRFACSGAIETEPQMGKLKKEHVEMVFQGHLVEELRALLLGDEKLCSHGGVKDSEYSLPKQSIEVALRKGVPERKRK
jgi:translation initiation factor 1 (eIF-1/SUI1)